MDYNCIRLHLQHHLQHKSPHFRISSLVLLCIVLPTLAADDFTRIDPLGKQILYDHDDDVVRRYAYLRSLLQRVSMGGFRSPGHVWDVCPWDAVTQLY
jgi:hypothetical protein